MMRKYLLFFFFVCGVSLGHSTLNDLNESASHHTNMFRVTYKGKLIHILGCEHDTSFEVLNDNVKSEIKDLLQNQDSLLLCERVGMGSKNDTFVHKFQEANKRLEHMKLMVSSPEQAFLGRSGCLEFAGHLLLLDKENQALHSQLTLIGMFLYLKLIENQLWAQYPDTVEESEGMDSYIEESAKSAGLHVEGLETLEEALTQMCSHIDSNTLEELMDACLLLKQELDSRTGSGALKNENSDDEMVVSDETQALLDFNIEVLEEEAKADLDELKGGIIRNYLWMPKLLKKVESSLSKSILFIPGGYHLLFKDGILALLKNYGGVLENMNKDGAYRPFDVEFGDLPESVRRQIMQYIPESSS